MSIGIVILAAGESKRMGEPKQLLDFRGETLLQHAIDTALSIPDAPVAVVFGARAAEMRAQVNDPRVLVAENSAWREGMGGSLRAGLRALLAAEPYVSAVVFMLCDQPLVSGATLRQLMSTHEQTGCAIVASEYGDTLGVPALFAASLFPELLALNSGGGARQIIHAHPEKVASVPFPDGAIAIDTPADYARLRHRLSPPPV